MKKILKSIKEIFKPQKNKSETDTYMELYKWGVGWVYVSKKKRNKSIESQLEEKVHRLSVYN